MPNEDFMSRTIGVDWYDRQGNKIKTYGDLYKLTEGDKSEPYRRVAADDLTLCWVSTVWIGLDMGWPKEGEIGKHKPLIFETMVFPNDDMLERDCERYSTEAEAMAGHARMVLKWKRKQWTEWRLIKWFLIHSLEKIKDSIINFYK